MRYLENYSKPIDETIGARVSCRTYQDRLLNEDDKVELLDFCRVVDRGLHEDNISYHFAEYNADDLKKRKLSGYGIFKNARSFLFGAIQRSDLHSMSYGYAMEYVVLKATELGLGTCWAGDFDPYLIKDVPITDKQTIPAILWVGYSTDSKSIIDRTARFVLRASKRRNWVDLFFDGDFDTPLTMSGAGIYKEPLELLRLAPSSRNTQPWRIVKDRGQKGYHFFKKVVNNRFEYRKMHDIDIGIAMCHFELGAMKNKLEGRWRHETPSLRNIPAKTHYMISWTTER
jgi:nitroreductase